MTCHIGAGSNCLAYMAGKRIFSNATFAWVQNFNPCYTTLGNQSNSWASEGPHLVNFLKKKQGLLQCEIYRSRGWLLETEQAWSVRSRIDSRRTSPDSLPTTPLPPLCLRFRSHASIGKFIYPVRCHSLAWWLIKWIRI